MTASIPHRCLVIAHRGGADLAPENTLAALRAGLEAGADAFEFDVRATKDGHLVLMHDETLERTTSGQGLLRRATLEDLGRLDAGRWKGPEFAGERVPTLREALAFLKRAGSQAVVEVKEPETAARVAAEIDAAGMTAGSVVISFEAKCLRRLADWEPRLRLGLLRKNRLRTSAARRAERLAAGAASCGASILDLRHSMLDEALVAALRARGLTVWTWTVNDRALFSTLASWGVDGVTTDRPQV